MAKVRFSSLTSVTESGDATSGWNYTGATGTAFGGTAVGADNFIANGSDGRLRARVGTVNSASFPVFGANTNNTSGVYTSLTYGIYHENSATQYSIVSGGTGGVAPTTVVAPVVGDIVSINRVGTTVTAEVSKDGGASWTVIYTWTGQTTVALYPAFNPYTTGDRIEDVSTGDVITGGASGTSAGTSTSSATVLGHDIQHSTPAAAAAGTTSVAPSFPATLPALTKAALAFVQVKPDTVTVTPPSGWTLLTSLAGGGGTFGADAGPTKLHVYQKDTIAGSEGGTSATFTVSSATSQVSIAQILPIVSSFPTLDIAYASGTDSTTGTAWSVTTSTDPGVQAGDCLIWANGIPTDVNAGAFWSAHGYSQTGVSALSAVTEIGESSSATGNDIGMVLVTAQAKTGTSSAAPVITATAATGTNARGNTILVRIRAAATGTAFGSSAGTSTASATVAGVGAAFGSSAGTSTASATMPVQAFAATSRAGVAATSRDGVPALSRGIDPGPAFGASAGTSTSSAVVAGVGAAQGASAGTSTSSATARGVGNALGSSSGTSTAGATALGVGSASGASAGTSTSSAAALGVGSADGASVGTSTGSATALGVGAAGGTSTGTTSASGTLSQAPTSASGASVGTTTAAGTLAAVGDASGASVGTTAASGTVRSVGPASGASAGLSIAAGVLLAIGAASGASIGTSSASAQLVGVGQALGASAGSTAASGTLTSAAAAGASGASVGTTTAVGVLLGVGAAVGSSVGTTSTSWFLVIVPPLRPPLVIKMAPHKPITLKMPSPLKVKS